MGKIDFSSYVDLEQVPGGRLYAFYARVLPHVSSITDMADFIEWLLDRTKNEFDYDWSTVEDDAIGEVLYSIPRVMIESMGDAKAARPRFRFDVATRSLVHGALFGVHRVSEKLRHDLRDRGVAGSNWVEAAKKALRALAGVHAINAPTGN